MSRTTPPFLSSLSSLPSCFKKLKYWNRSVFTYFLSKPVTSYCTQSRQFLNDPNKEKIINCEILWTPCKGQKERYDLIYITFVLPNVELAIWTPPRFVKEGSASLPRGGGNPKKLLTNFNLSRLILRLLITLEDSWENNNIFKKYFQSSVLLFGIFLSLLNTYLFPPQKTGLRRLACPLSSMTAPMPTRLESLSQR